MAHPARPVRPSQAASICLTLAVALAPGVAAQVPDSARRDSGVVVLPDISVGVTRVPESLQRVPAAVSVLDSAAIRRGRPTLGLSESLNELPGVYVANRYNFSLDERVTIRGVGARANFGIRGIQVLLDGVPQTAPDGQSQMTNVDLDAVSRIEVLRGNASSLYGNASGGVLSLATSAAPATGSATQGRLVVGDFGMLKANLLAAGHTGPLAATLALSHTDWLGFRQHSGSQLSTLSLGGDLPLSGSTSLAFRLRYTDQPVADNPGALTFAEYEANRDSAAPNNLLRDAGKAVQQGQASLTLLHVTPGGSEYQAVLFGIGRTVRNPLAAPPPQGPGPDVGTYVALDRSLGGLRLMGITPLGAATGAVRINYGIDLQSMHDQRTNSRAVGGRPDTLIQDQDERVTEVGPFAQLTWNAPSGVSLSAGLRYDWLSFEVTDHFLADGIDQSGQRTMEAPSGHLGVSYLVSPAAIPYLSVATSFETPTTTELANSPGVTGGFNPDLGPQTSVTFELGGRGTWRGVTWSVAGYATRVEDAITQYTEVGGRAYFTNAGRVDNRGIEARVDVTVTPAVRAFVSYTYSHFRFDHYRLVSGATVDTLDGNTLPAVPESFLRVGLRAAPWTGAYLDVDLSLSTRVYADDANTLFVNGWGTPVAGMPGGIAGGVTNVVLGWEGVVAGMRLSPFLGVTNLFDRSYVGAVTVNGIGGRVYEPAPRRALYAGLGVGYP